MFIVAALVPEWLWETELLLTYNGRIPRLRQTLLLCQSTEIWGLFVTIAQAN